MRMSVYERVMAFFSKVTLPHATQYLRLDHWLRVTTKQLATPYSKSELGLYL